MCLRADCPDYANDRLLVPFILREDAKSSFFVAPLISKENINDRHASVQDFDVSTEDMNIMHLGSTGVFRN